MEYLSRAMLVTHIPFVGEIYHTYILNDIPVVPHKAVTEVQE